MKTLKFIVLDTDNKTMRLYDELLREIELKEGCEYSIDNEKLYMCNGSYSRVIANVADSVNALQFGLREGVNIFIDGIKTFLCLEYSRLIRRVKTIMIDRLANENKKYDVLYCDDGEPYLYCHQSNMSKEIYVDDNLNIIVND